MDVRKGMEEGEWKEAMKQKRYLICAIYLILIAVAEFSMTLDHPKICTISHAIILFVLLFHSVLEWDSDEFLSRFLMALLLVPLIRILSFSLPYVHFNGSSSRTAYTDTELFTALCSFQLGQLVHNCIRTNIYCNHNHPVAAGASPKGCRTSYA
jgi:hypothetical protein